MDLSELDAGKESGEVMKLRHPVSKEELPVTIALVGIDSERFRAASREIINRRLKNQTRRRDTSVKVEEIEAESLEQLAAATLGWEGVELDGKALPFSHVNALKLYRRLPWVKDQVDTFVADRENFLKALPTS